MIGYRRYQATLDEAEDALVRYRTLGEGSAVEVARARRVTSDDWRSLVSKVYVWSGSESILMQGGGR